MTTDHVTPKLACSQCSTMMTADARHCSGCGARFDGWGEIVFDDVAAQEPIRLADLLEDAYYAGWFDETSVDHSKDWERAALCAEHHLGVTELRRHIAELQDIVNNAAERRELEVVRAERDRLQAELAKSRESAAKWAALPGARQSAAVRAELDEAMGERRSVVVENIFHGEEPKPSAGLPAVGDRVDIDHGRKGARVLGHAIWIFGDSRDPQFHRADMEGATWRRVAQQPEPAPAVTKGEPR
jgi:hypothetical protein